MGPRPVTLGAGRLGLKDLTAIADGAVVEIAPQGLDRMAASRAIVKDAIRDRKPVYGVTTGLGPKVVDALPEDALASFSVSTIRGRAHAVGDALPARLVRGAMAARLQTLLSGASGASPALAAHLRDCLNAGVTPFVGETASIGAADLLWGGMMGLALIGEGEVIDSAGDRRPATDMLKAAGVSPYSPGPRDGLALASHSCFSAAIAGIGAAEARDVFEAAQTATCLSMEGFRANLSPLDERVLSLRPQAGQTAAAQGLRDRLAGSGLEAPGAARRLQDPLSIRNIAQVHGATLAALACARDAALDEVNGASDNPAVLVEVGEILSNGGYLTPHLTISLNALAQAITHLAALQTARMAKLLSNRFTDLPAGLSASGPSGAGLGPLMKTAEALFAEIAHLATPAPIYPGFSADGLEDVVTHAAIPAKALLQILSRWRRLVASEMIIAAQAVELRGVAKTIAPALVPVFATLREQSSLLTEDRPLYSEIDAIADQLPIAGGKA